MSNMAAGDLQLSRGRLENDRGLALGLWKIKELRVEQGPSRTQPQLVQILQRWDNDLMGGEKSDLKKCEPLG